QNFMYRCFPASQVQSHAWVVLERRRPSHRSPNSFSTFPCTPFHRCVLIHLGLLEIFPGELLVGADLLIGPVLFGSTDVCLIVGRVREDVICFLAFLIMVTFPAGSFWSFCFWAAVLGAMTLNPEATSMLSLFFVVVCVLAQLINSAVHPAAILLRKRRVVDFIDVICRVIEFARVLQSRGKEGQKEEGKLRRLYFFPVFLVS